MRVRLLKAAAIAALMMAVGPQIGVTTPIASNTDSRAELRQKIDPPAVMVIMVPRPKGRLHRTLDACIVKPVKYAGSKTWAGARAAGRGLVKVNNHPITQHGAAIADTTSKYAGALFFVRNAWNRIR